MLMMQAIMMLTMAHCFYEELKPSILALIIILTLAHCFYEELKPPEHHH